MLPIRVRIAYTIMNLYQQKNVIKSPVVYDMFVDNLVVPDADPYMFKQSYTYSKIFSFPFSLQ